MEPAIFPSSPTRKPTAVKAEAWRLRQHAAELEKEIAVARAAIPEGYGNRLRIAALVRAQLFTRRAAKILGSVAGVEADKEKPSERAATGTG
jgi:hypothetical protein